MPRLVTPRGAVQGLVRCRGFLEDKAPAAARRAARVIADHFQALESDPEMGRPVPDQPELRELVIPFGAAGYVALYRSTRGFISWHSGIRKKRVIEGQPGHPASIRMTPPSWPTPRLTVIEMLACPATQEVVDAAVRGAGVDVETQPTARLAVDPRRA